MFAVISYKGNQYKVIEGKDYKFDLIDPDLNDKKEIIFDEVLLLNDGSKTIVGTPHIEKASVSGEVQKTVLDSKDIVFKFKSKKRYKKTQGHRQAYSLVKISKINFKNEK